MRDTEDQTNEHQQVPGAQVTAANVGENIQTWLPADSQHDEVPSTLTGSSPPCATKSSPGIGEDTELLSAPASPADLSLACHTHQQAPPQPSEVQLAAAREQAPMAGYGSAVLADRPPQLPVPPVGLSSAHRQIPCDLPPSLPDATVMSETAPPAIHHTMTHTGGPVAHGNTSGQLAAVPSSVVAQGHDASAHEISALEHANVPIPAPGAPFPAVLDPLLPIPLQQDNPADTPALPSAPASHPPTEALSPDSPPANAPQHHVPFPASNSAQLSLASEPPQQQVNASAAPLAHLDSPDPASSVPSITKDQPAPAAIALSKQSAIPGGPLGEPEAPSVVVAPDPADTQMLQESASVSASPSIEQGVHVPDAEQGLSMDAQKAAVLWLQTEGHLALSKQTLDNVHATYQEWLAQQGQAGVPGDEKSNENADEQLAGQDCSIREALGTLNAVCDEHPGRWAEQYVDGHLRLSTIVPGPLNTALNEDFHRLLQELEAERPSRRGLQKMVTILGKIVDDAGTIEVTSNPGAGPASDTAPAQAEALTGPIGPLHDREAGTPGAGPASDTAPAQAEALTGPIGPLHDREAGTPGAGPASDTAPAQAEALTGPIGPLHDREAGTPRDEAASDQAPAQGQASTAPGVCPLSRSAGNFLAEGALDMGRAQDQADTGPLKTLHGNSAGGSAAGAAPDTAPAQDQANTALMDVLHCKGKDNTRTGDTSNKAPAHNQASTAPTGHVHDKTVGKNGAGAAFDIVPAEGHDSTCPPEALPGKEGTGAEAVLNKASALSQASTVSMKAEISSSTDTVCDSEGSKHGGVVSMADDRTGQAGEPLEADVPTSPGRRAEKSLSLEGMI